MCHLCKAWSIPVYRLSKICEQFDIPRPGPDYWPLLRLNCAMERTPLPPVALNQTSVIRRITPQPVVRSAKLQTQKIQPVAVPDKNQFPDDIDKSAIPTAAPTLFLVAQDFRKAHPLIRTSRELLEKETPDNYGRVGPCWQRRCVNISVTKQNLKRALLIMDAIFRNLESKGHKAELIEDRYERFETGIKIGAEKVRVKIMERTLRRESHIKLRPD